MPILKTLTRMVASVVVVMALSGSTALAQSSDTETIYVEILRHECNPPGSLSVTASTHQTSSGLTFAQYDTESSGLLRLLIQVDNAACDPWAVTAELGDFKLQEHPSETFPASTFVLTYSSHNPPTGPQRWGWSPSGPGLEFDRPTAPGSVTFSGSPIATGSGPILRASTAPYGSPGNNAVFYDASLTNLPPDIEPGTYTSDLVVTVQGDD